ncbi:MAG: polysaccharide biosynthesis protein [Flavobacteria bacterium RIFCSPLOWO2_12_FULL_35_11]|nr:MAG: polysaccharide biosynthesis protein [Flavobacteria bacterium RIFCSPLOWO2_12_FULL_35_11]
MLKRMRKQFFIRSAPSWLVLAIDLYWVVNNFLFAHLIRFNFNYSLDGSVLKIQLPVVIAISVFFFLITGSYKGIIRHTGTRDAIKVTSASFLIMVFLMVTVLLDNYLNWNESLNIPMSIIVIHFLLNTLVLIGIRFLFKIFYDILFSSFKTGPRVLIYGAGEAGLLTYSIFKNDKANNSQIVGFIDDDKKKQGKRLNGLIIYNSEEITQELITSKNVTRIIIAMQYIKQARLIEIVAQLATLSVKVKIVPPTKSWINSPKSMSAQIKSINIEDLLGRSVIELDSAELQNEFSDKVVLITGAAGSIGSEISRQLANFNYRHLILVDQAESDLYNLQQYFNYKKHKNITCIVADVRNQKRMDSIFEKFKPEIVFHAAAYKHVPFMEENPYEAVLVNVFGTKTIADLVLKHKVKKFVMVSTDKAVNPTNVMGATKRIAEMYITSLQANGTSKFITTRFGNVLGSSGSVIPLFKTQIKNGGPITLTHKDITRYFMTIPEACQLVLEAGIMGNGGEIFVFDMGSPIKIYDLALNMIQLSNLKYPEDIDIEITGLRPGEKIYEELLGDGENTIPTHHNKIMIAKVKTLDAKEIGQKINELCDSNRDLNFEQTVAKMKEIVPEFISNNSIYEKFDL